MEKHDALAVVRNEGSERLGQLAAECSSLSAALQAERKQAAAATQQADAATRQLVEVRGAWGTTRPSAACGGVCLQYCYACGLLGWVHCFVPADTVLPGFDKHAQGMSQV